MSSFFKKMKLAAETIKDVSTDLLKGEELTVSEEECCKRLEVCSSCPYFIKEGNRCNECGCFMKLKANLKSSKCPIGKW